MALCILSWQELLFPLFFPMLNHSGISLQVSAWSLRSWVQELGSPQSLHFLHLVPIIENFFWGFFPSNSHPGRSRSRRASEPLPELHFLYKWELSFCSQKPRGPATRTAVCYYHVGFKISVVQLYRLSCRVQSVTRMISTLACPLHIIPSRQQRWVSQLDRQNQITKDKLTSSFFAHITCVCMFGGRNEVCSRIFFDGVPCAYAAWESFLQLEPAGRWGNTQEPYNSMLQVTLIHTRWTPKRIYDKGVFLMRCLKFSCKVLDFFSPACWHRSTISPPWH